MLYVIDNNLFKQNSFLPKYKDDQINAGAKV